MYTVVVLLLVMITCRLGRLLCSGKSSILLEECDKLGLIRNRQKTEIGAVLDQ